MKRITKLSQRRIPKDEVVGMRFGRMLAELSVELNKQLGVLVDRRGEIRQILIGDPNSLPSVRAWEISGTDTGRLRGLRLVHTHLSGEPIDESDRIMLSLLRLDMAAALIVPQSKDLNRLLIHVAYPAPDPDGNLKILTMEPESFYEFEFDFLQHIGAIEEEISRRMRRAREGARAKRALLVGVTTGSMAAAKLSIDELARLCETAGLDVVGYVLQRRPRLDPKFLTGSGKLQEILLEAMRLQADLIVFDQELSPSQLAAIGDATELGILDRTMVILDIFAQRAKSRDGKLQVELAQLRYRMPRIRSRAHALSRLTGGIGGRGPGETKLEIDRRRVQDRIRRLEKELSRLGKRRMLRRDKRRESGMPQISIVGYTNAGKSTLLNALTGANAEVEDKLFATLDPMTRRLRLPSGRMCVVTDTVGFIRRLPDQLRKAFASTIEEITDAVLLIHLVDASDPFMEELIEAVEKLLFELGLDEIPQLLVFNKADAISKEERIRLARMYPDAVFVSAREKKGLFALMEKIDSML